MFPSLLVLKLFTYLPLMKKEPARVVPVMEILLGFTFEDAVFAVVCAVTWGNSVTKLVCDGE